MILTREELKFIALGVLRLAAMFAVSVIVPLAARNPYIVQGVWAVWLAGALILLDMVASWPRLEK